MMKIILIIIDGLGDEPIPALKNQTPLEAARTPNLDYLAKNGISGLVLPYFKKGKLPTSEDGHLALFGYQPEIFNPGRGVLEVLGMEAEILSNDICLRGNFATVDKDFRIIDRRAGRIEDTEDLIKAISGIEIEGVRFLITKGISHRIGIIMRSRRELSPKISDGDPKEEKVQVRKIVPYFNSSLQIKQKELRQAEFTAEVLNQFLEKTHLILKYHPRNKKRELPANYILTRGAGIFKKVMSFKEKYQLKSACIAGGPLYKGIAKFLGMKIIEVKGANALPTTNLKNKFFSIKNNLRKNDFIFCHIKAVDNFAEDGNFFGKKEFIEKIDRNLKILFNLKHTLIVVTSDHSTCSLLKRHCKKLIPILIYGKNKDRIKKFSEKSCQKGKLGRIKQLDVMPVILEFARK